MGIAARHKAGGVLIAALVTIFAGWSGHQSPAATVEVMDSHAIRVSDDVPDEHIRNDVDAESIDPSAPPFVQSQRDKPRGPACGIDVENRTRWIVRIYVDGDIRATVGPFGKQQGLVVEAPASLYARTRLSEPNVMWGPKPVSCDDDVYMWRLFP